MRAKYQDILDLIGLRVRFGGWTAADAMDAGARVIARYEARYGAW